MKQTLKLLSTVTLLSITGCNIDKPPPGEVATWEKNGVTDFTEVVLSIISKNTIKSIVCLQLFYMNPLKNPSFYA